MKRLCWSLTPSSFLAILLFFLIAPLSLSLPLEFADENGPIEWLQVIILAAGCLTAIAVFYFGAGRAATRRLFLCSAPVWLVLIGRELSWGRVFFPNPTGGILPLKEIWYGPYVYPTVAVILIGVFAYMFKTGLHKELVYLFKSYNLPAIDGIVFLISVVLTDFAEHYGRGVLGSSHVLVEELAELVMYFALVSITVNLGFYTKFQPRVRKLFPL